MAAEVLAPNTERKETHKNEEGHARSVGGKFNEEENLTYKPCVVQPQDKWVSAPAYQGLEV